MRHAKTITVSTAKVPHVGTVLTTASGLTLYRFTEDPAGGSTCTGACAKIWPPMLAAKGTHIKGPKGVKGLSLIKVGNGHWQVAFHNVALYRFEGDKKKGQAKGQAIAGAWFAVLKSGIPAAGAAGRGRWLAFDVDLRTDQRDHPAADLDDARLAWATPSSPPVSQMPATQSTSPPPTDHAAADDAPADATTPTTMPTCGGGYGY